MRKSEVPTGKRRCWSCRGSQYTDSSRKDPCPVCEDGYVEENDARSIEERMLDNAYA